MAEGKRKEIYISNDWGSDVYVDINCIFSFVFMNIDKKSGFEDFRIY